VPDESTDALVARLAEMLRSRAGIREMHGCESKIIYGGPGGPAEYSCASHDNVILNDMIDVVMRDIDSCIESVEASLRLKGVTVTRPKLKQQE
jgi:hypothetical protein